MVVVLSLGLNLNCAKEPSGMTRVSILPDLRYTFDSLVFSMRAKVTSSEAFMAF